MAFPPKTRCLQHALSHTHVIAATHDFLESLPHLQAPEGVNERVDDGVAHDQHQVGVEVRSVADAVGVHGAGDDEDEVEEERRPADDEDPQEDGDGDGALHAGALRGHALDGQRGDALDVQAGKQEHVHVQGGHEQQHGEEHGDEAHDDGLALRVGDEDDAADDASHPDEHDEGQGFLHRHDAVVTEGIENGDVPVDGYDQEVADGGYQGDADHGVKDVVHVLDEVVVDDEVSAAEDGDHDGLQGVGHAHQHICHGQAAQEEIHGRVQVPVLQHCQDDEDVLQQADDAQGQEDLGFDEDLLTEPVAAAAVVGDGVVEVLGGVEQHGLEGECKVCGVHCQRGS